MFYKTVLADRSGVGEGGKLTPLDFLSLLIWLQLYRSFSLHSSRRLLLGGTKRKLGTLIFPTVTAFVEVDDQ